MSRRTGGAHGKQEPRAVPGEPPPQDRAVDRRSFLRRMGALSTAAAVAGAVAPPPILAARQGRFRLDARRLEAFFRGSGTERLRPANDAAELTVWEAGRLMREGELAPSELLHACLERIRRWDRVYMAFNEVLEEAALDRARELDGIEPLGALHGIPLAIKDNFYTEGVRTTANSWIYQDFIPAYDATAVRRLKGAGGVILGKTQMGPLATTRALTPDGQITTVNAWAPGRPSTSPGGSSSGSATAVAARMAAGSIGTQTGGSITQPALAQGLTGLKPTLGRVSLRGVIPLTYTRDHVGPIARDARDAALLLQAMSGPDAEDPRSLGLPPVPDYLTAATPVERGGGIGLRWPTRLGVLPGWDTGGNGEASEARTGFLSAMAELGADIVEVSLPAGWEELTSSSFNAGRLPERSEIFLEALRTDVRLFGVTLSSWINGLLLSGDEYLKAQRARSALLQATLDEVFSVCDVVVQTSPVPFDMMGLPLVAFPVGTREQDDLVLPQGIVLGGPPFGEERLLSLVAGWQAVSEWHRMRPSDPAPGDEARLGGAGRAASMGRGTMEMEAVAELSE